MFDFVTKFNLLNFKVRVSLKNLLVGTGKEHSLCSIDKEIHYKKSTLFKLKKRQYTFHTFVNETFTVYY